MVGYVNSAYSTPFSSFSSGGKTIYRMVAGVFTPTTAGNYLVNGAANVLNDVSFQADFCEASNGHSGFTPPAFQLGDTQFANLATTGALHAGPTSPVTLRCKTSDSASLIDGGVTGVLLNTLNGATDKPAATHTHGTLKQQFRKLEAKAKAARKDFKK